MFLSAWVQYAIEGAYSLISSIARAGHEFDWSLLYLSDWSSLYLSDCASPPSRLFHLGSCLFWLGHRLPQIGLFILPACLSTPALLRFLAPQSSIAWLDSPPVSIQDGRGGLRQYGGCEYLKWAPISSWGLVGIWNRIPRSCGSVSTQGWKEEQHCWWRSKQPRQHQS